MALNNNATYSKVKINPFQAEVESLLVKGVKFYLCQNTARKLEIETEQLIPVIRYATVGITAVVDFQRQGVVYVQT